MRNPVLLVAIAVLASPIPASPATAQVSSDDQALDSLKPDASAPARAPAPVVAPKTAARPARPPKAARPARTVTLPALPATPPANPVIRPPVFAMPAHKTVPPPPVPVRPEAQGVAVAVAGGLQVTFGAGSSDLNPATFAALREAAARALAAPGSIVSITAFAPGAADDPSTPRRLSLDRALAVRAVLIREGVVSDRIRAVAKGAAEAAGAAPDRVELVQTAP